MSPSFDLQDRVALVTGAARGIGLAVVQRLAANGARVVGMDLPGSDWREARAGAPELLVVEGSVAESADWERAVAQTLERFGRLDILVNNAGISGQVAPLLAYDDDNFDRVMQVNARGVYLGMKHAARAMKAGKHGGSIVNMSSVSGLGGGRFTMAYSASKHAVVGMTKVAATELASLGIRVNAVCPAPTATEMMFAMERHQSPDDPAVVRRAMSQMIPMGRYGEPDEIAAAVCFLASDAASFISGAALPVDGALKAS